MNFKAIEAGLLCAYMDMELYVQHERKRNALLAQVKATEQKMAKIMEEAVDRFNSEVRLVTQRDRPTQIAPKVTPMRKAKRDVA